MYRRCLNIPWVQKGFCQVLQHTSACGRVYNFVKPISRNFSSGLVKMIQGDEARKETSGKISSGSKQKRSLQPGDKNEVAPKRAKLSELVELGGEPGADKDTSLIICFDLELTDGSFASEIFQVSLLYFETITHYFLPFHQFLLEGFSRHLFLLYFLLNTITSLSKDWGARRGERVQLLHPPSRSDRLGGDEVCERDKGEQWRGREEAGGQGQTNDCQPGAEARS